jgi:serine phosphatase RsbU (regulator of sigma subunit)
VRFSILESGGEGVIVEPGHREHGVAGSPRRPGEAMAALAEAAGELAAAGTLVEALQPIAEAAAAAARAEVAVIRTRENGGQRLLARAVAGASSAVAAELEATWFGVDEVSADEVDRLEQAPHALARAARRARASVVFQVPVCVAEQIAGTVELLRASVAFDATERDVARVVAAHVGLAVRAFADDGSRRELDPLRLIGDALAAGGEESQTLPRIAAEATNAAGALLWRIDADAAPELAASYGIAGSQSTLAPAGEAALRAAASLEPVSVETLAGRLPAGADVAATLRLGQPAIGALQLVFAAGAAPTDDDVRRLATFGVRATRALLAGARVQTTAAELQRTRALLALVGQATSELSLVHTLETAVARVAELLEVDRLAVYLRSERGLDAAAWTGLEGPHVRVAERLLELLLGPFRGRELLAIPNVGVDQRLASVAGAAAEAGIEGVIALPLRAHGDAIGLLAAYPQLGRKLTEDESALVRALAAQLAVAVQNAQLHEETKRLGDDRQRALQSERAAARELGALYEISRSFAQSLSLETTLDAVATTVADVLDVDVAVIGFPDERREWLVPRALYVRDSRLDEAVRTILARPLSFGAPPLQRLFRLAEPVRISNASLAQLGEPASALAPFVERGWTGAVVPMASAADEVLASLMILSVRPGAPVDRDKVTQATALAGQAALAIDNARLYQQQKEFADTMQRSLLPRSVPALPALEVGDAYQSSARVEVGGDVYDFLALDDHRLAVVLGDVTGHGIEAAADMAMAKFVFRSLAREHPGPAAFLASANDVVVGEIAPGKFITMVYLVVDGPGGTVAGAGAGHPPPRIVDPDGTVRALDIHGLVLGIEPGERYEEVRASLPVGASVVLYTDGVLEARREGELYGFERLDTIVSAARELSAQDFAETVLADCRDFANNELADDCAVVVIKRTV